ncbi:hypothetical protein EPR50_G00112170 [Perca flavescens]|uniref:Uncharacterized protein n=1 Tax=Perca flavescens TaxID=8167 RepID=A0A484CY97_PERFV|nr:hypothetical protein EPR50_G00112170 [Perca flavescens]
MGVLWSDTQPPLTLFVSFLIIISAHLTTFTIIISAPPDLDKSLFGLLRTYFFKSSPSRWSYPQNTDPGDPTAVSHFCQGLDHLQLKFSRSLCCHSHKIYLGCFPQMCWRWLLYEHCSGAPVFVYLCGCQVAFLQCRQHLRVLVPRGRVLADRQGSGGPVVLSLWPTCLLLHRGEWGALLRATHTHTHGEKNSNCNRLLHDSRTGNDTSRQLMMKNIHFAKPQIFILRIKLNIYIKGLLLLNNSQQVLETTM